MFTKTIEVNTVEELVGVFGDLDTNIKRINKEFSVQVTYHGNTLTFSGERENVMKAERLVNTLIYMINQGEIINDQSLSYAISLVNENAESSISTVTNSDCICITSSGKPLKAKTVGQAKYLDAISKNTITIGVGPAGTGKTYLAVAMAVKAFRNHEVNKIILTRPAVEAGEKLGFLPGDLQQKVDPYLRPLYDGLFDMMGSESFQKCQERGEIEVVPLAYMRGRTLDNSFIILDEAQNTTSEQMKMFLTRLGYNSKAIVTGDITQTDLPDGKKSGLSEVIKILKNIDDIKIVKLSDKDIVRHRLVQKIITAYEKYEESRKRNEKR